MMRMHVKQLAFAVALGTAMAAGAQTPSYPAAAPATDKPTMAAPAKGDSDATKACANLPAAEKEACLAKANKSGSAAMKSPDTTTPSASPPAATAPAKSDSAPMKSDSAPAKSDTTTPPK